VQESFSLVEMIIELQEQFPIRLSQEDLRAVRTVGDLLQTLIAKTT
jgi:acyl carrier protein